MPFPRIIPSLLLRGESLVKGRRFRDHRYIGDPVNTVKIFNELEVDELLVLDIDATRERRRPRFDILRQFSNECFMPLAYGGGINTLDDIHRILEIGFEKVVINTVAWTNPRIIPEAVKVFGSQAVIGSVDYKRNLWHAERSYVNSGKKKIGLSPLEWAKILEQQGVGELLLTSIDREGTWVGMDIPLIKTISNEVSVPVIAQGGAGTPTHIFEAIEQGGAAAVAVGSMVVYQKADKGVLVNFPDKAILAGEMKKYIGK